MKRDLGNLSVKTKVSQSQESSQLQKSPLTSIPTNRKGFITAMTALKNDTYSKILQTYNQLQNLIIGLNTKVQQVLQKHQVTFLLAYRNEMKRIRQQLQRLRKKNINEQIFGVSQQKIDALHKQLSVFRQEAYRLFQKLQIKERQNQQLKLKYQQSESEKIHLQNQIKRLARVIKLQEVHKNASKQKINPDNNIPIETNYNLLKQQNKQNSFQTHLTETKSKTFIERLRLIITHEEQFIPAWKIINQVFADKQRKYLQLKWKYENSLKQTMPKNIKCELQNFFLQCVETVRKDIYRKSQRKLSIGYNQQIIDFQIFKKQDKCRILEQLMKNEDILKLIYNQIFTKKSQMGRRNSQDSHNKTLFI